MELESVLNEYLTSERLADKKAAAMKFVELLQGYRIVIYGAGAAGTMLLQSLRLHAIEPLFFVDRRWESCGEFEDVEMRGPEALETVNTSDTVVILAINAEVIRKFNQEPMENIRRFSPEAVMLSTGIHVNRILQYATCCKRLEAREPFDLVGCLNCGAETELCGLYQEYLRRIAPGRKILAQCPSKKFDWFGYIMGQYCSLRCRDCCEHVPYFERPVFSDRQTILADCAKIAASCEFIRYIELIGGEPFLHPEFKQVLEGLLEIENVGYVKVFTNGTIVPGDEVMDLLKDPRIVIDLSNYTAQAKGGQLANIYRTKEKLERYGVPYVYSESKEWTDWGDFHDRGRTEEELKYNASHCFCYNCHRVFQGILYRCPHQYAGIQLGEMDRIEGEYIDLNACGPDELALRLEEFESLPFTDGCRRCDMPFDCAVIPAGLQLE